MNKNLRVEQILGVLRLQTIRILTTSLILKCKNLRLINLPAFAVTYYMYTYNIH